ncbi:MAG TPA: hypothetical protein VKT32_15630, partial [Chthonomonadaceae bacterium]|nr:hypothetical protein [Chthonomonadaceae bacterium]
AFAYRWLRGGQVVTTGAQTALPGPVLAGQDVSLMLPVKTAGLADGDYTLEISPVSLAKRDAIGTWIGDTAGSASLKVPVQVREEGREGNREQGTGNRAEGRGTREEGRGQNPTPNVEPSERLTPTPDWAVGLVQTDLPNMLESGSVYDARVTLRNEGATTWRKADGAQVALRLFRATIGPDGVLTETPVPAAAASAALPQDVPPGQEVSARLLVPLLDPEGKPLPTWKQDDLWTYTARWEVATRPAGASSPAGAYTDPAPVDVVAFDFGARFTADGTPAYLPGQHRLPVRLSLQNVGPQIWKKNVVRVGYHWYYEDGTEFLWEDETTPIPQDVPPGGRVDDLLAWVTPPPLDGIYWLVWDVKVGDTWASTAASTRVYDQIVRRIQVIGGHLLMADLSKDYNLDGITADDDLAGGDFDGQGRTFPAELMPPFADTAIAPATMWLPATPGPDSPRRISFLFGLKDPKEKNFIVCKGQRLELGKSSGQCRVLHLLAATTGQDVQTQLRLIFQEPTSQSEDLYTFAASRWDRPPTHGEEVAFLCRRHHERNGIQPGAVALYHYAIPIHEPRKLVAIQLPNAPALKIAAITLEP